MKQPKFILILALLFLTNSYSQVTYLKHLVKNGETVNSIAQIYKINPNEIYKLNPDSNKILKPQTVLLIPQSSNEAPSSLGLKQANTLIMHQVGTKETLFSIAKKYQIEVEEIQKSNPQLTEKEIQVGQVINIPVKDNLIYNIESSKTIPSNEKDKIKPSLEKQISNSIQEKKYHEVKIAETKYSIAKQYGLTISDIDESNPEVAKNGLKAGDKIVINSKNTSPINYGDAKNSNAEKTKPVVIHKVQTNETKYGIAKKFGITVEELEKQNPHIINNLEVGTTISVNNPKENSEINSNEVPKSDRNGMSAFNDNDSTNYTIAESVAKWKTNEELAEELIRMASQNLGTRYRAGGTTKNGFDCSGLMFNTFSSLDIKLPRSSFEQSGVGTKVSLHDAQKGDLIFFKTRGKGQINHVGMVVEVCDDEVKFIHSSVQKGVIISSTKEKYYEKNFKQINRVLQQ